MLASASDDFVDVPVTRLHVDSPSRCAPLSETEQQGPPR